MLTVPATNAISLPNQPTNLHSYTYSYVHQFHCGFVLFLFLSLSLSDSLAHSSSWKNEIAFLNSISASWFHVIDIKLFLLCFYVIVTTTKTKGIRQFQLNIREKTNQFQERCSIWWDVNVSDIWWYLYKTVLFLFPATVFIRFSWIGIWINVDTYEYIFQ